MGGYTQSKTTTTSLKNNTTKGLQDISDSNNIQSYSLSVFVNPTKYIDGSIYLFNHWNNPAKIISINEDVFSINNINFNIRQQVFQSKINNDSIFTFEFNSISKFIIRGKTFKCFRANNQPKIFEIISESEKFILLKNYRLDLIEGSSNPMVNRKNDKYKTRTTYFIIKDDLIKPFKLRKKNLLDLFNQKSELVLNLC